MLGILTYVTLDDEMESNDAPDAFVKEKTSTKIAILGLFANLVDHESLMKAALTGKGPATIFMAMLKESSQRQDDIWHRGLVILDELELTIDDIPTAS